MGWRPDFIALLARRSARMVFVFRSIEAPVGTWGNWPHQAAVAFASSRVLGVDALVGVVSVEVDGSEVTPRSWSASIGGFSVTLAGRDALVALVQHMTRGTFVELLAGEAGWGIDQFEVIAQGQLRNVTVTGQLLRVDCRDLAAALGSRPTIVGADAALFNGVGTVTAIATTAYVVGDGTLNVTSTTGFEKESSAAGAILVTPDTGDPFYLTYTGTTATTFTGCSATGQFGTTAGNAAIGKAVVEVAYVGDHPVDLARRVWASTGTASANGIFDTLPESWGYGLTFRMMDYDDINLTRVLSAPSSGSMDWDVVLAEAQADGFAWLSAVLALGGWFLAMRQGNLTVRCAVDPNDATPVREITDADIVEVEESQLWDDSLGVEYNQVRISTPSAASTDSEPIGSLPAEEQIEYDYTGYIFGNETAWRTSLDERIGSWAVRIPERHRLALRGLSWAALTPGDVVSVTSAMLRGRLRSTSGGMVGRRAMVMRVAPEWMGGDARTSVTLSVLPDTSEVAY